MLRWVGGATVAQLEKLFAQGERAVRAVESGSEAALAQGRRALRRRASTRRRSAAYREALKRHAGRVAGLRRAPSRRCSSALQVAKQRPGLRRARRARPAAAAPLAVGRDASPAPASTARFRCPRERPAAPGRSPAFEADGATIVCNPRLPLSADDRSALYGTALRRARGRRRTRPAHARSRASGSRTSTAWPRGCTTPSSARPSTRTGSAPTRRPARSRRRSRCSSSPRRTSRRTTTRRRAWRSSYQKLKRYDEALAASDRALALVYGPRRVRVLAVRADIQPGRGDAGGRAAGPSRRRWPSPSSFRPDSAPRPRSLRCEKRLDAAVGARLSVAPRERSATMRALCAPWRVSSILLASRGAGGARRRRPPPPLQALFDEQWEFRLAEDPLFATNSRATTATTPAFPR